jgi:hypothetical protein
MKRQPIESSFRGLGGDFPCHEVDLPYHPIPSPPIQSHPEADSHSAG